MADHEKLRILVIEDESTQRMLAKEYLEEAGHLVRQAEDGRRGLKMASVTKPDVILLDVLLPVIDGYSLCRKFKENPETAETPVILITASREADVIERGLAAGADDFVTKPVDWTFLSDRVVNVVRKARACAEMARQIREQTVRPELRDDYEPRSLKSDETAQALLQLEQRVEDDMRAREQLELGHKAELAIKEAEINALRSSHAADLKSIAGASQAEDVQALGANSDLCIQAAWSIMLGWVNEQAAHAQSIVSDASVLMQDIESESLRSINRSAKALKASAEKLQVVAQAMVSPETSAHGPVELNALIQDITEHAETTATARRVSLTKELAPSEIWVNANRDWLRYALLCLVSNSLRFTPAGGAIELALSSDANGAIILDVCDNGVGIGPAKLEELRACLDRPIRHDSDATAKLGLGLPASMALIRRLGGVVDLDSQLGEGTRASIVLPYSTRAIASGADWRRAG